MKKAIFFDRDGVLIEDTHLLSGKEQIIIPDTALEGIKLLKNSDFKLIVITNQTVVARGILTESEVVEINRSISERYKSETGVTFDKFYYCPHHPNADLINYRKNCECRKPKPGMILQAQKDFTIDLTKSYMIGDRISDINAGNKASCKTILLETGKHLDAPIKSDAMDLNIEPDFTCRDLTEAVKIILK